MTISVNEQVAGHKVIVTPAGRAKSGQRRASCQCGWESGVPTQPRDTGPTADTYRCCHTVGPGGGRC
jgi:hypothetical protein